MRSNNGLLTTVCYQFGNAKPVYALEGSIAVTGSAVQWLRDQLGIISGAAQSEALACQVPDNGGMYFVPAFSGLFAPYWRSDARGAIVGLSRFNTNAHLARATLEAICYQSRDVVDAMEADSGVRLQVLKVDGGITGNDLCMQIQADVLGVDVVRPVVAETTALGVAYAAGLAVGFWAAPSDLRANWREDKRWTPTWTTTSVPRVMPAGARRCSGPWIGLTCPSFRCAPEHVRTLGDPAQRRLAASPAARIPGRPAPAAARSGLRWRIWLRPGDHRLLRRPRRGAGQTGRPTPMRRHLGPWRLSCGRQRGTQSQQFTPVSFGEDGGQDQLWWNSGWRRRSDAGNHITGDPVGHLLA